MKSVYIAISYVLL